MMLWRNLVKKLCFYIVVIHPHYEDSFLFSIRLWYTQNDLQNEGRNCFLCCLQGLNFYLWVYPCNLCQDFVVKWYSHFFFSCTMYIHTSFVTWWYNINDILIEISCWLSFDSWIEIQHNLSWTTWPQLIHVKYCPPNN